MNMDSSSHHQNWLGFSLSNQHHQHINPSHLCLFEAFTTTTTTSSADRGRAQSQARGEDVTATGTDLSIFTPTGPKLEDFLGSSTTAPPPPPPQPSLQSQFLAETAAAAAAAAPPPPSMTTDSETCEIYDSELKSIAACFLRGFSNSSSSSSSTTTTTTTNINQEINIITQNQPLLAQAAESAPRKTVDTFGQRTSIYRGVTRHRWTGRYEAHLWDNSCRREGQSRKGRQVYLGGYDKEEKAARAYDLAALKYWGPTTTTNFPISNYQKEIEEMKHMTRQEFVASLRRKSSGFSRGASIYRGVTRHHQHGRWQARIGRVAGNKDLYLGTFSTQEEAAEAYDIAAIKFRGLNAVTNFDMSRYDVKSIANSNLPIGGISGKSKNSSDSTSESKSMDGCKSSADDRDHLSSASSVTFVSPTANSPLGFTMPVKQDPSDFWSNILGCRNTSITTSVSNNTKNETGNNVTFHSFSNPLSQVQPSIDVDFNVGSSVNCGNNNGILLNGGGGYYGGVGLSGGGGGGGSGGSNVSSTSSNLIPFAAPVALNSSSSNYEGSSNYGGWIAQSIHSLQSAKPNVSIFQTPIFGME